MEGIKSLVLTAVVLLVISTDPTTSEEQSADEIVKKIENDFWRWRLQDAPEFASQVGDTSYNDILESFNVSVYQTRKDKVSEFMDRLGEVNSSSLSTGGAVDFVLLSRHLQTFLDGAAFDMYQAVNPVNFMEGVTADPGGFQLYLTFSTIDDFHNYTQRLSLLPKQIDEKIELMRISIKLRHTLHNVSVEGVLPQIDQILSVDDTQSPFYVPAFTTKLNESDVSDDIKETVRTRALAALGHVKEALRRLKTFLEDEYMPNTRTTWGVGGLANGTALYEQCLRYHTSTDMTPQQVHDLGLSEMARIQTNMQAALDRLGVNGTLQEFYKSVRRDPHFYKNTSEELLQMFEDYIAEASSKLSSLFKNIPDYPLRVLPLPYDGPNLYQSGSQDGTVPGTFYANVMNPASSPTISMMSLTLHETLPGHHLQTIYSFTANLPPYRAFTDNSNYYRMPATFPINTAYIEGWGLYAEFLGEEMGVYTDDYMLMGRYSDEIFRAVRLVVDTGLHYFGWERQRAIEFMLNNTAKSRQTAEMEINRYLTWPGQATAYKIGEIKLRDLRNKATAALGDHFDIRDFHSLILENGKMPLDLLEQLVDEWIASHPTSGGTWLSGAWWSKPLLWSTLVCWSVKELSGQFF
ncbi:uncharacterized protein LOC112554140 [Pomacea canaliculata]|uniref:uncharacterized protein LOC112554140 n=1 Tax=Pomacea canaliculata TaxID=400727 RepID=UPI000D72B8E4|nr:uncharacterized protein LOC112554140 [Pomacea canaliculata]XP_025077544.1 uncharacterized protein LOC112554140 [Pomacea canaliculata]XP_025077545.1 uncharacterized protein LOC112554140 [Pomacea canaliculata]